jgi:hypothetical protein
LFRWLRRTLIPAVIYSAKNFEKLTRYGNGEVFRYAGFDACRDLPNAVMAMFGFL